LEDGDHVVYVRAMDNGLLVDQSPSTAPFELDTTPPVPQIVTPASGEAVQGTTVIGGTAQDEDGRFDAYRVIARVASAPQAEPIEIQTWTSLVIENGVLANWDTSPLADDWYTLEVQVRDTLGVVGTARVNVLVDNDPPFANVTSPLRVRGDLGATVYSAAGDASIAIPPFAFEGETVITVEREAADGAGGYGYRLGPEELKLRKRSALRLNVPPDAEDPTQWSIHRHDGSQWVQLGGTLESGGSDYSVSVAVDALGLYALRAPTPPPTSSTVISALSAEPRHLQPRTGTVQEMSISFVLGRSAPVTARVYNRAGRARRVLVDGRDMGAGEQVLYWDGRDENGDVVASALYILCVEAEGERVTQVVTVGRD
jgi:hypothetical protein